MDDAALGGKDNDESDRRPNDELVEVSGRRTHLATRREHRAAGHVAQGLGGFGGVARKP